MKTFSLLEAVDVAEHTSLLDARQSRKFGPREAQVKVDDAPIDFNKSLNVCIYTYIL